MEFNYARALKVPYLIQKIYKDVSFTKPKRLVAFGVFGVCALVSATLFSFVISLLGGMSMAYVLVYVGIPFLLTKLLLDVKKDGRALGAYLYHLICFQCTFGFRHGKRTITHRLVDVEQVIVFKKGEPDEKETLSD
ncbi:MULTISPECIES: TcpE family conjugal transfer membrane protein [unclassified Granulicatella]|uniref:TcpE family conjugal transfer membrane protein n=1 Tax=unclassified Granulicatella TaxID=2630493 RepID=UPI0010736888|nr:MULTISPECIES: TcpE family conjugal transfer membrane protein [unclassified Granulicatella]MBF0780669.1 hypothetical protein [Granulicatella sp. 19428wC4_WM01]TFU94246.1 hypothetical protein E4T68_06125 [Granulicatella sp. WM01]